MIRILGLAACFLLMQAHVALAQTTCQFYAQNPDTITVSDAQNIEREVEIDFRNTGATTWQNTGGVSNLSYIELRPVTSTGVVLDGPLYHNNWINRQRVGSFLAIQQGVAPNQVARFVFKVQVNGAILGVGTHDCYFRPYHAQAGYISDWGLSKIRIVVTGGGVPSPGPGPTPGPTTLSAHIQSASFERSVLNGASGTGAYVEQYDMIRWGAVPLRQYQVLQLQGSVQNGTAVQHEWTVVQNGVSRMLGTTQNMTSKPDDLFVGQQQLRYRAQDANGSWSSYDTVAIDVTAWPRLLVPVHGSFTRSGNDYNQGDHLGTRAAWAQDWNGTGGGNTDFGLELIAGLSGLVSVGQYNDGGRYVNIEHTDASGQKFRLEYMHLSSVLVRQGETVSAGQPIGLFGNTGSASQLTHLHYVCSQWVNGAWVSVAPEPCFIDSRTVKQVIRYNEVINADTHVRPATRLVLAESAVSAPYHDEFGYGHTKYWSPTTAAMQPTAHASWDVIVNQSGTWKLWMHNPSTVTNDNNGLATHNTTSAAIVEINRPRVLGLETYRVDQAAGIKGGLIEVCQMDLQSGDRLLIRQHNATGETAREVSFDELVLTLESAAGSGGAGGGNPAPGPVVPANPMPSPTSPTNPTPVSMNTSATPVATNNPNPFATSGQGGGGGCALSYSATHGANALVWAPFFVLLIVFCGRRYCVPAQ